ncbi:MAG: glycosyltransferase family 2 protein [Thermoanaerobaculia bacterium]|nr:glycosyltransferase family 2 protein [Thermoanaerobaculia bacterium]
MLRDQTITIIIPAYREADFIGRVIAEIPAFVDHVVLVDDCSDDATVEVARRAGDSRLQVCSTSVNSGVGAAMRVGYRRALEIGGDIFVKVDGDGQMPLEYLSKLVEPLLDGSVGYAKGNRFLAPGVAGRMPAVRLLGNTALTFLNKLATGYWHIFDPQNGYTAIRADALGQIDLDALANGYFFENDMLFQLYLAGVRVRDVAIPARYGDEQSDMSLTRVLLTFPPQLLRRFASRIMKKYVLYNFSPVALFLLFGLGLFGWGLCFGIWLWVETGMTGRATPTGTIMLALLPLILGFQLLLQAVVLDIQETPR